MSEIVLANGRSGRITPPERHPAVRSKPISPAFPNRAFGRRTAHESNEIPPPFTLFYFGIELSHPFPFLECWRYSADFQDKTSIKAREILAGKPTNLLECIPRFSGVFRWFSLIRSIGKYDGRIIRRCVRYRSSAFQRADARRGPPRGTSGRRATRVPRSRRSAPSP